MIVYNITTQVHPAIEKEWNEWQKKEIIPAILTKANFYDHKFFRLLETDDTDGITYVTQFFSETIEEYKNFIDRFAAFFREQAIQKWNDQFVSFETVMETVN